MDNILDRLASALPDLPTKMASAARFALDHPDRIALASMRSVATECGVASPTMLRLARLMNFESYEDFKAAFQEKVIAEGFGARAGALRNSETPDDQKSLVLRISEAASANVTRALAECDATELRLMAKTLLTAGTTYVIGAGSMQWMAALMQSTGRMALPGLRVPRSGDASVIETLGAIGSGDAVLALAISPYARSTLEAVKFARERHAKVMVITDKRSSALLEFADLRLLAVTKSPHYYPSVVALAAVIEALLATVVVEGGDETLGRIAQVEDLRERSGAYIK